MYMWYGKKSRNVTGVVNCYYDDSGLIKSVNGTPLQDMALLDIETGEIVDSLSKEELTKMVESKDIINQLNPSSALLALLRLIRYDRGNIDYFVHNYLWHTKIYAEEDGFLIDGKKYYYREGVTKKCAEIQLIKVELFKRY